jgi:hypothetical protein
MVVNQLKMRRDRDIHQHQKPKRMLKEKAKWFNKTGDWVSGKFLRIWTSLMCVENDLRNGQTISSSIMTTLLDHTSLLVRQLLSNILRCAPIHLIHRISHRANSGSSPKSKWPWKIKVLNLFRTSRQPRQRN